VDSTWVCAYRKYFRFWVKLAKTIHISEDDAEDIVHGVVSGILQDPKKSFESIDHIRNYVAKAVLNRAIQAKHRGEKRVAWTENTEIRFCVDVDDTSDDRYFTQSLKEAILRLPRRDFDVVKLRYYAGYTFEEMSQLLRSPISTLKSREEAALKRIRKCLRKKGF